VITEYINAALRKALYKVLEDGSWFAEIPGFEGVWGNGATVEECREELKEVLEEWLILKIRDKDTIPLAGNFEIRIPNPHGKREIHGSLVREILTQAGISPQEWDQA
jgi:predicted RNase H-like HicB family nuclease